MDDLNKKYVGYADASEERKKRIEARDQRKQKRYAAHKERVDAKRQRYADKMEGKGILTREQALGRFDQLRGIKARSAELLKSTVQGKSVENKEGDRVGYTQDFGGVTTEINVEDPKNNESLPNFRFNSNL